MALKSAIYKVSLQLSDFDRDLYQSYSLNVALHPSETIERMLLRLVAYAHFADERLLFTKGLSTDEEPDLWIKSLSDEIDLWIDLGLPDLKRIRKAAGKSKHVAVFAYGGQKVSPWYEGLQKDLQKVSNLSIYKVDMEGIEILSKHAERNMEMSVMIQDASVNVTLGECYTEIRLEPLYVSD